MHRLSWSIALALALLASPARAEFSGPQLSLVGSEPKAPALQAVGSRPATTVRVVVRNDSSFAGPLQVAVVPASAASVGPVQRRVARRGVVTVPVTLSVARMPKAPRTVTLVIAGGADVSPLTLPVTLSPPAAQRFDAAKLTPTKVTIEANWCAPRILDSLLGARCVFVGQREVSASGVAPGAELKAGQELGSARAAGDTSGDARAVLEVAKPIAPGDTTALLDLDVTQVSRSGSYEMEVAAGDGNKAPAVTVAVAARDAFIFPLIVLLLGAGLAYALLRSSEITRPRKVLQLAITSAARRHRADRRTAEEAGLPVPYHLEGLFPPTDVWSCDTQRDRLAVGLYCEAQEASRQEQLDALGLRVADLQGRVAAWLDACRAAAALGAALAVVEARDDPLATSILAAGHRLLRFQQAPEDAEAAKAFTTTVRDQVTATQQWLAARDLLAEVTRVYADLGHLDLDDREQRRREERHPKASQDELAAMTSLGDLQSSGILQRLRDDLRVLSTIQVTNDASAGEAATLEGGVGGGRRAIAPIPADAALMPDRRGDTAARLLAELMHRDRVHFAVTAAITAAAYFATIYPSESFGSLWDYVAAFAAGVAGELLLNFRLLPWFRSYAPAPASA